MRRRFKGLCVFITWPQLPQVLSEMVPNLLVMLIALHFLKTSWFLFSGQSKACVKLQEISQCVFIVSVEGVQNLVISTSPLAQGHILSLLHPLGVTS